MGHGGVPASQHAVPVAGKCGHEPIERAWAAADGVRMHPSALDHATGASARHVAVALAEVEAMLRSLDRTCLNAAAALIPPAGFVDDLCTRYRLGAAQWDADAAAPSYERQAAILSSLHDAGATLRAAAECCARARTLIERTY